MSEWRMPAQFNMMFIKSNGGNSKTDLFIFKCSIDFGAISTERRKNCLNKNSSWTTWRFQKLASHKSQYIVYFFKIRKKNSLTHRWCHFLGNLWRMDCWRFLIVSPVKSIYFRNKRKTNVFKNVDCHNKNADWCAPVAFILLFVVRSFVWFLFLIFLLIASAILTLDRGMGTINQARVSHFIEFEVFEGIVVWVAQACCFFFVRFLIC